MVGLVESVAIGFLIFLVLIIYIIARQNATKFIIQVTLALAIAFWANSQGWSETMAFIGLGITLGMAFFTKT